MNEIEKDPTDQMPEEIEQTKLLDHEIMNRKLRLMTNVNWEILVFMRLIECCMGSTPEIRDHYSE